ncbi:MAG: YceI family protein [Chitinophagaceae bacterium]
MKKLLLTLSLLSTIHLANAEKFFTKSANITFDASGPLENIHSKNGSVAFLLNTETGDIQTSAAVKSFVFDKQLMQEHFNENYMESEKFSKSTFKGTITNNSDINYKKDGTYTAKVSGKLTMHGVTQDITTTAKIIVSGGRVQVEAQFNINCSDYGISIPGAVKEKVSNKVKISLKGNLEKM